MNNPIPRSAAQAARQSLRDNAGRYAEGSTAGHEIEFLVGPLNEITPHLDASTDQPGTLGLMATDPADMPEDSASQAPLGVFRAVATRDPDSLARDGQPFVRCIRLDSTTNNLADVQFADGTWLTVDTDRDLVPAFGIESAGDRRYVAQRYGGQWNGWATPVVDQETMAAILEDTAEPHAWYGNQVFIGEDEELLSPEPDGLYDTGKLGWMFEQADLD